MGSLIDDLDVAADWVAGALHSSGYRADFSPASLWSIDQFLDDHSQDGQPRRRGLLAEDLGARLFALGAYVGEVVRRDAGASWQLDDQDPDNEIDVRLVLDDGRTVWPVQRVMKRFSNGHEDGIAAYGAGLGLEVGPPPQAPRRRGRFGRRRHGDES